MGNAFWELVEKWIYRLTIVSLPLWILSNLVPTVFNDLSPYFERITTPNFLANTNYWSALVYTHAHMDNGYGIFRNCGFMWEPGAFSLMIIVALIYNWLKNDKMVFNTRVWVYTIALASTFSTAGYFAFVFLLMGYFIKKLTIWNIALMLVSIGLFYSAVYELDFISGKINKYNEAFIEDPTGESGDIGHKVNRFQGGVAAVIRTWKFPIGYGLVSVTEREDEGYAYGTNGLGSLLEMWGFFLFPVLIFLVYKSLLVFNKGRKTALTINLFFVAIMIVFFSNPIHRSLTTYFLIITPLVLSVKSMKKQRKIQTEYVTSFDQHFKYATDSASDKQL